MKTYKKTGILSLTLISALAVTTIAAESAAFAQTAPDRYMISLLDRSGSMSNVRSSDNKTRWQVAKERAKEKIAVFSFVPGLHVSVWTFTGSSYTNHTNGFVSPSAAITAIDALPGPGGSTPLAMSACDAVDQLIYTTEDRSYRILALASDGEENTTPTVHPCYGPGSVSDIPPYDSGSWNNHVYVKAQGVVVHVDLFNYIQSSSINATSTSTEVFENSDEFTTGPVANAVSLASFFRELTDSTGGTYNDVGDNQPAPVAGDVTGDYCVNDDDVNAIFAEYGMTVPPADPKNDLTGDRIVDYYDYQIVINNYGSGPGCP